MTVQLEVIFNSSKHEIDIKTENNDALKQLLNANKSILSFNKSILLELENNKLCSNGFMTLGTSSKVLQAFFDTLAPFISPHSMTIDIVDAESKTGLLLRYKSGNLEKTESYSA